MMFREKLIFKYFICFYVLFSFFVNAICTEFEARTFSRFKSSTASKTETKFRSSASSTSSSLLKFKDKISHNNKEDHKIEVENGLAYGAKEKKILIDKLTNNYNTTDWKGWVKYFKIRKGEKPKSFYKNFYFFKQNKEYPKLDLNSKTEDIYDFIRDDNFFYLALVKDYIIISNTRKENYSTIYQAISLHNIVPLNPNGEGGIVDFGQHPEGYCFKLLTVPFKIQEPLLNGQETIDYVFCTENEKEKEKFMNVLVQLKLNLQKDNMLLSMPKPEIIKKQEEQNIECVLCEENKLKKSSSTNSSTEESQNGKWVIIKDWSQCSVKCGGGFSTLQRFCVGPKGNGKPCEGDPIVKRICNTTPCNLYVKHIQEKSKKITPKPEVKIMPFSDRPQRYIKCKIKENDLMMFKNVKNNEKTVQIYQPVRIVMNNFTISIYESSNFNSHEINFELKRSELKQSTAHSWCFILTELDKEVELCNFSYHDKVSNEKFIREWNKDFHMFKNDCHTGRFTNLVEKIENEIKEGIADIQVEIEKEKTHKIQDKIEDERRAKTEESKKKLLELGEQALQKEKLLEKYILEEKNIQEEKKISEIRNKLMLEKEREKRIVESIDQEQIKENDTVEEMILEKEMDNIKNLINNKILDGRKDFVRRMRLDELIKKRELDKLNTEIIEVRNTISKEFDDPNKMGVIANCLKNKATSDDYKKNYCLRNYNSARIRWYMECTTVSFCNACCQNEFGSNLKAQRTECISQACKDEI